MRLMLFSTICLGLLLACAGKNHSTTAVHQEADTLKQGLQGRVLWVEGNMMPRIAEDTQQTNLPQKKPVSRTLYIYELTHQDEATQEAGFYTEVNTTLVKKVQTGSDGQFSTFLPAGRYSLFVEEKQGLYANLFDGQGHIYPVNIEADSISQVEITVDYKAVY